MSNNKYLYSLNIFCLNKWFISLIICMSNNNLKQFLDMNELFDGAMFMSALKCNAFSLPGILECLNWKCCDFFTFLLMFKSSHTRVFCKKGAFENFKKFSGKHLCRSLFLNKVASPRPANLIKRKLQH